VTRRPNSRLYISGHRFLSRRLHQALLTGEVGVQPDPVRAQSISLVVGAAVAAVAMAGCAALAWLSPQAGLGDAKIVMGRTTGALYVRVGDTVHPVLNLTSARLIAQADDDPRPVDEAALASTKRGPLLGIPGAPGSIGTPLSHAESIWTACDGAVTTVIAGPLRPGGAGHPVDDDMPVLVTSGSGNTYLLYAGRRAALDLTDLATVRALRLEGVAPRPVSAALLSLVPEAPSIAAPVIPDAGGPGPAALPGLSVGDVVQVQRAGGPVFDDGTEYYVVLAGGVQRIGPVTADLIRFSRARADAQITAIEPAALQQVPTLGVLGVAAYPQHIGSPRGAEVPVVCASWTAGAVTLSAGDRVPLDESHAAVPLAQADGAGPAIDAVLVPPGRTGYIRATGAQAGTDSVVVDTGVRFVVDDEDTARMLGLPDQSEPAPWSLVSQLPTGPPLGRDAALVARDVIGASR
jgi:type VII secretion protein EccB